MTDVFDKELPLRLKRYLDLNRERLVRAKSVMTVKAQKFLSLIPLNGFIGSAPGDKTNLS